MTFTKSLKAKEKGFTLIELMICIIIVGILSTIAVPIMRETFRFNRLNTKTSEVITLLEEARVAARQMNKNVCLRPITGGDGTYNSGLELVSFINGTCNPAAGDNGVVIAVIDSMEDVSMFSLTDNNATHIVNFLPNGFSDAITFNLCISVSGTQEYAVTIRMEALGTINKTFINNGALTQVGNCGNNG
ncbi:MAG: Tfp pilus assembly protein FimT/FimU [Succinivibrionaceae bacterium]